MSWDVRPNQRVEADVEKDGEYIVIRGIVLDLEPSGFFVVSDRGKIERIDYESLLSIRSINFPRIVSDVLVRLKNHYVERVELQRKMEELKNQEKELVQQLKDAVFLSNFSLQGAVNRLYMTIEHELLSFSVRDLFFYLSFSVYGEEGIVVDINVKTKFEHYQEDVSKIDTEKVLRVYHPSVKEWLEKAFPSYLVTEEEAQVFHEEGETFCVSVTYRVFVPMNEQTFLDCREKIKQGIIRLKS